MALFGTKEASPVRGCMLTGGGKFYKIGLGIVGF